MQSNLRGEPHTFSLSDGGPFYHLMRRLHLVRSSGMVASWWLALFAWVPIMIGEGLRVALGSGVDPMLFDISMHERLLIAMPVILLAERWVEGAARSAVESLYKGKFCDRTAIDRIVDRGEHLRDTWWVEAILAVLAIVGGQLVLWRVLGSTGLFHAGLAHDEWTFPRVWYALVAFPLAQFVMFRFLWRWAIWSYMLVRFALLPLMPIPTHPDKAAGLSLFARPVASFGAFAFAVGSVLAGAWGSKILADGTTIQSLLPSILVFVLAMLALAVTPLLAFCGHLYRTRRGGLAKYGNFANVYTRTFDHKWLGPQSVPEQAVGSSDIQSLADLGNAYNVISKTRLFAFGGRSVIAVWSGALLPMVPLFASLFTVEGVLKRIISIVLGGLPG